MSPFVSNKQRKFLYANEPEVAAEFTKEEKARRDRVRSKKSKKRKRKKKAKVTE